jgi:hypothetical protein
MPATPAVFDVKHSTLAANVDKELDPHMFSLQVRAQDISHVKYGFDSKSSCTCLCQCEQQQLPWQVLCSSHPLCFRHAHVLTFFCESCMQHDHSAMMSLCSGLSPASFIAALQKHTAGKLAHPVTSISHPLCCCPALPAACPVCCCTPRRKPSPAATHTLPQRKPTAAYAQSSAQQQSTL